MEELSVIKISVRELVEFVLRSGDLVSTFSGSSRNTDAIRAHQKIQKSSEKEYKSEVTISHKIIKENIQIEINGRIDGVIELPSEVIIDEIKTTMNDLDNIDEEYNLVHWAQAKCYAYFYCLQNELDRIKVRLTYYQMNTEQLKQFVQECTYQQLDTFFNNNIDKYIHYGKLRQKWYEFRNISIKELAFPYGSYRKGQRELAVTLYNSIRSKGIFFAKAPTGIGKTIATIFPSIKALGEGITSKIFYLTAKNTTSQEVEKALKLMEQKGLKLKSVWITAKDKICFEKDAKCDPEKCEYARGHFDRVNDAIEDIYSENMITREVIEAYAIKHKVCPFEFSLDLTNWCECVVCDYNYAFDPRVYLKRFFSEDGGEYTLLVDEAHNLVDRARDMYSAELIKSEILNLKNLSKSYSKKISKTLNKLNSYFIEERKKYDSINDDYIVYNEAPKEILPLIRSFMKEAEGFLLENKECTIKEDILDIYFKANAFVRTFESFNDKYVAYSQKESNDVLLKLFCMDPSSALKECLKKVQAAVFFSATLSPMNYFIELLGGNEQSYRMSLPSPFKNENLCIIIDDSISTKYKNRALTCTELIHSINYCVRQKKGNYLVFFPSYEYMQTVYNMFTQENSDIECICQKNSMNEEEREQFIKRFTENNTKTLAGFVVLGGIFGEGLDLPGEKLIGAVIVGVGLPKLSVERNILQNYFNKAKGSGFQYSYVYPGINKVLQAAGRVIRTEEDKGVVMLIDERYSEKQYYTLLPNEWKNKLWMSSIKRNKRI